MAKFIATFISCIIFIAYTCNGQLQPNEFDCNAPVCTEETAAKLWPSTDSRFFYQCTAANVPQMKPCGPGTRFGFSRQVCVHEWDFDIFKDNCGTISPANRFSCREPVCTSMDAHLYKWPHINNRFYYSCNANIPALNECLEDEYVFGYRAQQCIPISEYVEELDNCLTSSPPGSLPFRKILH